MNYCKSSYRPFLPMLFNEVFEQGTSNHDFTYKPMANIVETNDSFKLEIALPGFQKEEIKVSVVEDILTVSAGHETSEKQENDRYTWNEFGFKAKYQRSFKLSDSISTESIGAVYQNGILTLTLAKTEPKTPATREISIA